MQFYIMMVVITFVFMAVISHIAHRKEGEDPHKLHGFLGYYLILGGVSVFWIITWPCLIIYGVIELITYLLDKSVLRKYLKKEKPE